MTEPDFLANFDPGLYAANRAKFTPEELDKYRGEHIAFSLDGSRIVAHGPDIGKVIEDLKSRGIAFGEVGWSFVPEADSLL